MMNNHHDHMSYVIPNALLSVNVITLAEQKNRFAYMQAIKLKIVFFSTTENSLKRANITNKVRREVISLTTIKDSGQCKRQALTLASYKLIRNLSRIATSVSSRHTTSIQPKINQCYSQALLYYVRCTFKCQQQ